MKANKVPFIVWLSVMFLATFTALLFYLVVQQTLRLGANEQPMQMASEAASRIERGLNISNMYPSEKIDISRSLNGFIMVFDNNKKLVFTTGLLENSNPDYPKGVLDNATAQKENRVTWQPAQGPRFATVAVKFNNGYVVGARSLSEVEKLTSSLGKLIFAAWVACAIFTSIVLIIVYLIIKKNNKKQV